LSREAGKRIVEMVYEDIKPSDILTPQAFRNAISVCMALGGSTNAVIHLTAIAGRLNISLYPDVFHELGSKVPCIADVQPAGTKLIDDFDEAGGVPAVMKNLKDFIDGEVITYTGKKLKTLLTDAKLADNNTIKTTVDPVSDAPTLAILSGNLVPGGAVIKVAAASPDLLDHTGIAFVFDNYNEMLKGVEDENLPVDASTILILRNAGPKAEGMPEWGMIPIPKKLRWQGVTDMVRISDARMSGTSFGTVILHVVPEASIGGPLAFVKNGDKITVDIRNRKLSLHVSDEELIKRKNEWHPPLSKHRRGYPKLYFREVLQADEGCDFDFLKPRGKSDLPFAEPVVGRS
jgi:dihydroxyacid dehydratase/phosphogluconate dehydratase